MQREFVLPENGAWVGPPVLVLELRGRRDVLDGRQRVHEIRRRGLKTVPPELVVTSHLEAIRALVHHGHPERAARIAEREVPHLLTMAQGAVARLLDVTHHKLMAFRRAAIEPSQRHKLPRRAIGVVHKALSIRNRMLEGDEITINDIEDALGVFLED